ncbi:rlmN, partial [Symbiodinium sp. KB8]
EFAKLLDSSWLSFRLQLLEAFPDELSVGRQTSALSSPRSHTSANSPSTGVPINNWEHSQIDEDVYNASISACSLHSGLKDMEQEEALAVSQRLRARLGAITTTKLVSGKSLHDAVVALGLTRYSVEDMNEFVNTVADFINLQFLNDADAYCATDTFEVEFVKYGTPVWAWPQKKESVRQSIRRISVSVHTLVDMTTRKSTYNVVPAQALMELFLSEEGGIHRQVFAPQLMTQFHAMKEILLAGDTN